MTAFSAGWQKLLPASAGSPNRRTVNIAEARRHYRPPMHASQQEWDSTLNTAVALAEKVLHRPLPERQRELGAVVVHYLVGAVFGAAYGAAREVLPDAGRGVGAVFGAAVFVLAQEIGTPRMGLSKPLRDYSVAMQANSLGEHVVWGVTTDVVARGIERVL